MNNPNQKPDPIIEVRGLKKEFGNRKILTGIDIDVYKSETLVLLGGSGSGKSVLTKHMVGLMIGDTGSVKVDGEEISNLKERDLAVVRKKMGIMFQSGALFDSMTVGQNVAFPLREGGLKDDMEISKRVSEALNIVLLEGEEDKMPSDLSGGMRKRVALARAIVDKPQVVIYDEPHAGLDPVTADVIDHLIKRLERDHDITNIVITHELRSVFRIASRIAFLKSGKIYWEGCPDEFTASEDPILKKFLKGESSEGEWEKEGSKTIKS